jgi:hypothetical protein
MPAGGSTKTMLTPSYVTCTGGEGQSKEFMGGITRGREEDGVTDFGFWIKEFWIKDQDPTKSRLGL